MLRKSEDEDESIDSLSTAIGNIPHEKLSNEVKGDTPVSH